jgi:hypothetical protein
MLSEANVDYYFNKTQKCATVEIIREFSFLDERGRLNHSTASSICVCLKLDLYIMRRAIGRTG